MLNWVAVEYSCGEVSRGQCDQEVLWKRENWSWVLMDGQAMNRQSKVGRHSSWEEAVWEKHGRERAQAAGV